MHGTRSPPSTGSDSSLTHTSLRLTQISVLVPFKLPLPRKLCVSVFSLISCFIFLSRSIPTFFPKKYVPRHSIEHVVCRTSFLLRVSLPVLWLLLIDRQGSIVMIVCSFTKLTDLQQSPDWQHCQICGEWFLHESIDYLSYLSHRSPGRLPF